MAQCSSGSTPYCRSFNARQDVRQDVDSENLLTCYLLDWIELKCAFRLFIPTLKHELAEFASEEGLKWLMTGFCIDPEQVSHGLKGCRGPVLNGSQKNHNVKTYILCFYWERDINSCFHR